MNSMSPPGARAPKAKKKKLNAPTAARSTMTSFPTPAARRVKSWADTWVSSFANLRSVVVAESAANSRLVAAIRVSKQGGHLEAGGLVSSAAHRRASRGSGNTLLRETTAPATVEWMQAFAVRLRLQAELHESGRGHQRVY
jgi:hypothetical protein